MSSLSRLLGVLSGCLAGALWPATATAANQEPAGINLGATSFYDGFGRNEEGFTYLVYAQYARSRQITGDDGNALTVCNAPQGCGGSSGIAAIPVFKNPKLDVYALVNQLAYTLPNKLFNDSAHLGINFILPFIVFDTNFDHTLTAADVGKTLATEVRDNGVGFGDLTFGPFMQFRPLMAGARPVFSHRVELDLIVPTGKYDPQKDINQGSNFWSINPYWAATVLPLPYLEVSARFHYLYNFKNHRPALGRLYSLQVPPQNAAMSELASAQAGQAGWVNFALSYELLHLFGTQTTRLSIGANGYYFQQFSLDKWEYFDGSSVSGKNIYNDDGKASVLGIGPGAFLELGKHDRLYANVYFQPIVRNRADSTVFNLHWTHGF
jgi:hypothetical protein